jgi:uncharacterized protein YoxC
VEGAALVSDAAIISAAALALALIVWGVNISRWTARVQTLLEVLAKEVSTLREARDEHSNRLTGLDGRIRHLELTHKVEE